MDVQCAQRVDVLALAHSLAHTQIDVRFVKYVSFYKRKIKWDDYVIYT